MVKLISEIIGEIENSPNKTQRTLIVDKYCGLYPSFILFLKYLYDPGIVWDITDTPAYKPSIQPIGYNAVILKEIRTFYVFLKDSKVSKQRKLALFIQLLESLDPVESELVLQLVQSKLKIKGFNSNDWEKYCSLVKNPGKSSAKILKEIKEDKEEIVIDNSNNNSVGDKEPEVTKPFRKGKSAKKK